MTLSHPLQNVYGTARVSKRTYDTLVRSLTVAVLCSGLSGWAQGVEHFEKRIRPVLATQCYACHSAATAAPQGGLLLDSARGIKKGGNSGPLFVPGDASQSLLIRALRHTDKGPKMPPGKPLAAEVIADFERWISDGAPLPADIEKENKPALWSLQSPHTQSGSIDQFIADRLSAKGLTMSPEADKRTLIRRADIRPDGTAAHRRRVSRLRRAMSRSSTGCSHRRVMASDGAGTGWMSPAMPIRVNDSVNAGQRYPWSYTYRDWVIHALNEDLPYDKFRAVSARGRSCAGRRRRGILAALGFLSLGREFPNSYPETVDDRIDAVTRGMLGLTVSCARCHDHKYDPIPTKDYYSLYSIFSNIRQPKELPLLANGAAVSAKQRMYQERLDRIDKVHQDYRARRHAEMVAFFKTQDGRIRSRGEGCRRV